jgi:hypothetical protein
MRKTQRNQQGEMDTHTQTNKQEIKQINKQTHKKIPSSGIIEFQSWYSSRGSVIVSPSY